MISDQTVWGDVARSNAGWVIPLDDVKSWNGTIKKCVAMAPSEYSSMSAAARKFAQAWLADTTIEDATAALLEKAVGDRNV